MQAKVIVETDSDIIEMTTYENTILLQKDKSQTISIPISSIEDKIGQVIIQIIIKVGSKTKIRTVYLNIIP